MIQVTKDTLYGDEYICIVGKQMFIYYIKSFVILFI